MAGGGRVVGEWDEAKVTLHVLVLVRQQGKLLLLLLVRVRAAFQHTTRSRCITTYYSETFVEHHIHKNEKFRKQKSK